MISSMAQTRARPKPPETDCSAHICWWAHMFRLGAQCHWTLFVACQWAQAGIGWLKTSEEVSVMTTPRETHEKELFELVRKFEETVIEAGRDWAKAIDEALPVDMPMVRKLVKAALDFTDEGNDVEIDAKAEDKGSDWHPQDDWNGKSQSRLSNPAEGQRRGFPAGSG